MAENNKNISKLLFAVSCIVLLVSLSIFGKLLYDAGLFLGRSDSGNGSMYIYDGNLYYGAKHGGICVYEQGEGSRYVVKKADREFAADDKDIYYTYKGKSYKYDILNESSESIEAFPEGVEALIQNAGDNSDEVKSIMYNNFDVAVSDPFAILEGDTLYVAYNKDGGYMAAYKVSKGDVYYMVDMESEILLDNTFTPFQYTVMERTVSGHFILMIVFLVISAASLAVMIRTLFVIKNK